MLAAAALSAGYSAPPVEDLDDCDTYSKIVGTECADGCLTSTVGICPRSIVLALHNAGMVSTGQLTAGTCKDLGYTVGGSAMTQKAGPCGNLNFNKWKRPSNMTVPRSSWTLGLQKCDGVSSWTLHGLWPPNEDCGGPSFDESQITDLLDSMKTEWLSCPEYGTSDEAFWAHEWSKHGSCSDLTEHAYFEAGLNLLSQYESDCNGVDGPSCELSCDGADGPCSASAA